MRRDDAELDRRVHGEEEEKKKEKEASRCRSETWDVGNERWR